MPSVIHSGSFNLSFQNEHIIYENEIRCVVKESEFNLSYNPSLQSDDSGSLYYFATGSFFSPYVTTLGLYNDSNELLAVAKLSTPILKDFTKEMLLRTKIDF